MRKLDEIQHKEYQKLKKQAEGVDEGKIMIWVLLSIERLWQPFLFSTGHLGSVVQTPIREVIDAIWQKHILLENKRNNDCTNTIFDKDKVYYYKKLLEEVCQKIEQERGSVENHYESYLIDAICSGFKWFFETTFSTIPSSPRWDITLIPVSFITDWLIDTYLPKGEEEEVILYQESSWIQEEFERIQNDFIKILGGDGKGNLQKNHDQLLLLKKKYQDLWIISSPSPLDK